MVSNGVFGHMSKVNNASIGYQIDHKKNCLSGALY